MSSMSSMSRGGPFGQPPGRAMSLVDVGGVPVADLGVADVIEAASRPADGRAECVLALHVGGLQFLQNPAFISALRTASLVYADGVAVVALGRLAGGRKIRRAPTTDIGIPVLAAMSARLARPARVAVVGGPPGLAESAGTVLAKTVPVEVVLTEHGFFEDDEVILNSLRDHAPDVILLGLGMPKEAIWAHKNLSRLPPAVVLTCGGWFGFLVGNERRAPDVLQRVGLEWTYRLRQDFRRLVGRYSRGLLVTTALVPRQLRVRAWSPSDPPAR